MLPVGLAAVLVAVLRHDCVALAVIFGSVVALTLLVLAFAPHRWFGGCG